MTNTTTLINRNQKFSESYQRADLPVIPKLRSVIITCGDARVDPAHIMGLNLGDSAVIRNNGGRVNNKVIEELAAMSFMVAKMDGEMAGSFEVIVIQHTQCGAERFSDLQFQSTLKEATGIDVAEVAIHDHNESIIEDIERLKNSTVLPDYITVSGFIYEIESGRMKEVISPLTLGSLRN